MLKRSGLRYIEIWEVFYHPKGGFSVLITTTNTLQGKEIVEYLGVASGQAIMGANVVRDFLAGITDVIGGRSGAYESKLNDAKEIALREMAQEARAMGGNAVIGVDLDFETIRDGMIMCIATGTAVRVK
jgi:uncharacterized protein YbjQ (UPF0145 family)